MLHSQFTITLAFSLWSLGYILILQYQLPQTHHKKQPQQQQEQSSKTNLQIQAINFVTKTEQQADEQE